MYNTLGTGGRCWTGAVRRFVFIRQVAALYCVKWRHGRHLESVTSNRRSDSVNRCIFTWTFLPNFIPIRLETTEP